MSGPVEFSPVRIGVVGLGRAGIFHIQRIGLREDCRVVSVYDDCPAARECGAPASATVHSSFADFLRDDRIEMVLLGTAPASHADLALAALAAGKHLLIETPMCLDLTQADAIIAAAGRAGRSVCVALTRRWDDDYRAARAALAEGGLGRPAAIKFINWHYNPHGIAQNLLRGPAAVEHKGRYGAARPHAPSWRDQASTGGGVLWEFGIHHFDQLIQLVGRPAESVYARLGASLKSPDAEDSFLAIVNFPEGLAAHIEVNRAAPASLSTGWMIAGESASYAGFTHYAATADGEVVDLPLTPAAADPDELYAQVARNVRCGGVNPVSAEEARRAIALIEAARRSARCGETISVD